MKNLTELELSVIEAIDNSDFDALEVLESQAHKYESELHNVTFDAKRETNLITNRKKDTYAAKNKFVYEEFKAKEIHKVKNIILDIKEYVEHESASVAIRLESKLTSVSSEKMRLANINKTSRLRTCKSFSKASQSTLNFIVSETNETTLNYLLDASNYKTSNRALQLAQYLNDDAIDSRTKQNIELLQSSLKSLSSNFKSFEYSNIQARSRITSSMCKNMLKALQLFNVIKRVDESDTRAIIKSDTMYTMIAK